MTVSFHNDWTQIKITNVCTILDKHGYEFELSYNNYDKMRIYVGGELVGTAYTLCVPKKYFAVNYIDFIVEDAKK